jgi:hypothetical protein
MAIWPMMTGIFCPCDITSTPEDDHDKAERRRRSLETARVSIKLDLATARFSHLDGSKEFYINRGAITTS